MLSRDMTFTMNRTENLITLTCITTGGPATTVTWTRDSTTVTEETETVLNDPITAQYTHILLATYRKIGLYKCTIANNVSNISSELNVQGKTEHKFMHCGRYLFSSACSGANAN